MPGGRSDEPQDIGTLELEVLRRLKVGDAAPGFAVKTFDGKPLKLADYRGKYVLLEFWAVWCAPCHEQTPHLRAAHEAFGKDNRFVMISLSLDGKVEAPKKYVADNNVGWLQAFLGDRSQTAVPSDYGVQGIPATFLIGPDGKILAKDQRDEGIQRAVGKALGR